MRAYVVKREYEVIGLNPILEDNYNFSQNTYNIAFWLRGGVCKNKLNMCYKLTHVYCTQNKPPCASQLLLACKYSNRFKICLKKQSKYY